MGPKTTLGAFGLMLLGVGLPSFFQVSWGWGGTLCFVGLVLLIVSSNSWLFGRRLSYLGVADPLIQEAERGDPVRRLTLLFDAQDNQCVRVEAGVEREYRVRVVNSTGGPAHGVHVRIEATVPELPHHVGVSLRRRHGARHESLVNLPDGASDYFNLLEYNPMDYAIDSPVLLICHTAEAPPVRVPVDNYEFTLRAYCNESTSETVTFRFEQLFQDHSRLVQPAAP